MGWSFSPQCQEKPGGAGLSVHSELITWVLQAMVEQEGDRETEQRARHSLQKPAFVTYTLIPPAKSDPQKIPQPPPAGEQPFKGGTYEGHFRIRIYRALTSKAHGQLITQTIFNPS